MTVVQLALLIHLPTTSRSPETIIVWKEGASADTSQLYLPVVASDTFDSVSCVSLDSERCGRNRTKCCKLKLRKMCRNQKSIPHRIMLNYIIFISLRWAISRAFTDRQWNIKRSLYSARTAKSSERSRERKNNRVSADVEDKFLIPIITQWKRCLGSHSVVVSTHEGAAQIKAT